MKKNKLNSKNPRYSKTVNTGPKVKERVEYKTAKGKTYYAVYLA